MTSDRHTDIQTDRQPYILPLVVLSAALQQKRYYAKYFLGTYFTFKVIIKTVLYYLSILMVDTFSFFPYMSICSLIFTVFQCSFKYVSIHP